MELIHQQSQTGYASIWLKLTDSSLLAIKSVLVGKKIRPWPWKTYLSTFLAYFGLLNGPKSMWVSYKSAKTHRQLLIYHKICFGGQGRVEVQAVAFKDLFRPIFGLLHGQKSKWISLKRADNYRKLLIFQLMTSEIEAAAFKDIILPILCHVCPVRKPNSEWLSFLRSITSFCWSLTTHPPRAQQLSLEPPWDGPFAPKSDF